MPEMMVATSSVVSAERKRSLLMEARRDRVAWVDAASVPFRSAPDGLGDDTTREHFRGGDEGLQILRSARACASMSSAVEVAKTLYQTPPAATTAIIDCGDAERKPTGTSSRDAGDRIKWLLESESDIRADELQMAMMYTLASKPDQKVVANGAAPSLETSEVEEREEGKQSDISETGSQWDDKAFISAYCTFLHKLRTPECADLVQATRRFVNSFEDVVREATDRRKNTSNEKDDENVKRMASMIRGRIAKSCDDPKWRAIVANSEKEESKDSAKTAEKKMTDLRQSIETFVFAKCHSALWSYLCDDSAVSDDVDFQGRLNDLQFVTPDHLDIHCLTESAAERVTEQKSHEMSADTNDEALWSKQLSSPIHYLQSVESQYSPARMLSCIHGVYRGINEALSAAMASAEKTGITLPSADDILPALILVVLRAQPRRIISNLNFVDLFATPDQLRGEVGYAFTSLFSAVQFLRDLNIENCLQKRDGEDGDNKRLSFFSMSPDEFKSGLEKCRKDAQKRAEEKLHDQSSSEPKALPHMDVSIPVHTVRFARSKGEVVDMQWASKWQNKNEHLLQGAELNVSEYNTPKHQRQADEPEEVLSLPDGFSRSYSFLSMGPEDVRISDVPQLLDEYKMLVRATECLISERNAKFTASHKEHLLLTRDKLENAVRKLVE